jgi:5'-AMP-activated protein kinase catalytic alpha subunit
VLEVDPEKRFRIEDMRSHKWWGQCEEKGNSTGIMVGYDRMPVDLEVLGRLAALGHDIEHAQRAIEANRHNSVTTAYYLLMKKLRKSGRYSTADICSPNFDCRLLVTLKKQRVKTMAEDELEDDIKQINKKLDSGKQRLSGANLVRSSTN